MADEEKEFDPEPLEKALEGRQRPVIIGGSGLMEDGIRGLLEAVCRDSAVPFLSTTGGKGVLREDSDCALGNVMAKGVAREVVSSGGPDHCPGDETQRCGYEKAGSKAWPPRSYRRR